MATMNGGDRDALPPSAKFALHVLEEAEHELTLQDVISRTRMEGPTVRYALEKLVGRELVEARPNPTDGRQTLFKPRDVDGNREYSG